ncbi:SmdB family multidrug efflux ABC transporter permease/ATP-binding protein [Buchnera aphidicola]|uniref:SmdB family multidrug efflux ABC transporter permease/ATP-binding protein n=1 Tax=Buchnera aphidicola TaxID=9 RepID=UPI0031B86B26
MANLMKFWPILKRLLIYGMKWKKSIILAFTMLIGASIAEVLSPILISTFINNYIIKNKNDIKIIIIMIISFITLQTISSILHYFQTIFFNKTAISIVQNLRIDVMKATLQQPIKKFNKKPIGKIISRVTNDTEVIKDLYDTVIATFFRSITLITTILIAMFSLEWKMAIISSIIFPLVFLVMIIYQYYSTPLLRKLRSYIANINNKFNETITGINVIQQFNQEKRFGKYIKKICKKHYKLKMKILRLDGFLLRPLLSLISSIVLCGIMILFIFFLKKKIEVGIIYAFISYLGRLNEPLISIATQQALLQQAIVAGERIFKLIDSKKQKYGNDKNLLKTGEIKIKNLKFRYKKNKKYILNGINITIPKKKFIAFVGSTGSGKSTLANLLMGYYPIKEGELFIDKRKINTLNYNVLRKGISIINQDPIIIADNFLKNIKLGRKISKKKILKALKIVKLNKLFKKKNKEKYKKLGEQGNILSSGQKQLLSLSRILINNNKILILDEATNNIDPKTEKKIQKKILSIKKNTTLIIISNRLSTIIKADKIAVFKKGKIIEFNTHEKLLKNKKQYWKMYKLQKF